jgi:hypothetical protein
MVISLMLVKLHKNFDKTLRTVVNLLTLTTITYFMEDLNKLEIMAPKRVFNENRISQVYRIF